LTRWVWRCFQGKAMLELLLLITFAGAILASCARMGIGNPFQIYFMIWFSVILGFYFTRGIYISVEADFIVLLIAAKFLSFVLLFIIYTVMPANHISKVQSVITKNIFRKMVKSRPVGSYSQKFLYFTKRQCYLVFLAQITVTIALPFAYLQAVTLAGGDNIFTLQGYIKLRLAKTLGIESTGFLIYFTPLAFVISSFTIFLYRQGKVHCTRIISSIIVSISYAYLSTGRTYFLMFMCVTVLPLVIFKEIRSKGISISIFIIVAFFGLIAGMTAKGISINQSLIENFRSFFESVRCYTISPLVAFSNLVEGEPNLDFGVNTFRFIIKLLHALGLSDTEPVALIKDYTFVPDPINVYSVYEVYFRDFSYMGIIIPPLFLVGHYWLYRKAIRSGGVWVFYYSSSVYPLVMQFFQDQYFSLLSMWIQFGFWFFLFCHSKQFHSPRINRQYFH
jgi:oligosaccharide repeat unit polymerase